MHASTHRHTIHHPIALLPASLLRISRRLHAPGASSCDVLILSPHNNPHLLARLKRIARTFRARGRQVRLYRLSRDGGRPHLPIETVGKQVSRPGGSPYRDSGGRTQYKNR